MERSLHRELKERYGPRLGGRAEVVVGPFRVDAVDPDGRLVELECAADNLAFAILDGIPVMLESEARPLATAATLAPQLVP